MIQSAVHVYCIHEMIFNYSKLGIASRVFIPPPTPILYSFIFIIIFIFIFRGGGVSSIREFRTRDHLILKVNKTGKTKSFN